LPDSGDQSGVAFTYVSKLIDEHLTRFCTFAESIDTVKSPIDPLIEHSHGQVIPMGREGGDVDECRRR